MTATHTANSHYSYTQLFYDKPLDSYIQYCHKVLSDKSGWNYIPLKKGSFGYDNLAVSIGYMLDHYTKNQCKTVCASYVHKGWCINYIYWRDYNPGENNPILYIKPYTPLGDERRNKCAETSYEFLPKDEQDKDLIIVDAVIEFMEK